jgi:hypothetical protein
MNSEVDEQWTVHSVMEYMSENFIGLILLILAFFIIYFVDHINQLNAMIFDPSTSLPNMSSSLPHVPQINLIKPNSKKQKLKRR